MTDIASRTNANDTLASLHREHRLEDARDLAAAFEDLEAIRKCTELRGFLYGSMPRTAYGLWRNGNEITEPTINDPRGWLHALRAGGQPWLPTPEDLRAHIERKNAEAREAEAKRPKATAWAVTF